MQNLKKGIVLPFLLLLASVAFILSAFFVLGNKPKVTNQNATISPKPSSIDETVHTEASRSVNTDEGTANWKTYTNKTYGFSFKYPSTISIAQKEGFSDYQTLSSEIHSKEIVNFDLIDSKNKFLYIDDDFISIFEKPENMDLEEWVNRFIKNPAYGGGHEVIGETEISGKRAIKAKIFRIENYVESTVIEAYNKIFSLDCPYSDPNANQVEYEAGKKICNQILSTFKFTD